MNKTNISWTDFTWNPITGCTKVSEGCKFCYAEGVAERFWGNQIVDVKNQIDGAGERRRRFTDIIVHDNRLDEPMRRKKSAKIFVCSMGDLFHEDVNYLHRVSQAIIFATMLVAPQHTYQVLTKRPKAMKKFADKWFFTMKGKYQPLPNVWLGVTAENQRTADERIPILLETPASVRFVSLEPLLERIDIRTLIGKHWAQPIIYSYPIDWVIVGCESGPKKRECKIEWVEDVVNQCKSAGVAVFVKQLNINGKVITDINKFPKELQIREFPS